MAAGPLKFLSRPKLSDGTMLLALTGWMDGGLVSTGTLRGLMDGRDLQLVASIDPDPFYIYNFPGSMEIASMFRPHVKYDDGLVAEYEMPVNAFYFDSAAQIIYFSGREPNLRWQEFADCIFDVAVGCGVTRLIFVGSFGGSIPHTREPRMFATVSDARLKPLLRQHGFRFSDYEGPSSMASLLLSQCKDRKIEMMSLVVEIPGYLQGANPLSIEAITRRLAHMINLQVDLDALRRASNEWEVQVTQAVEKDEDLAATVKKLEEQYDNELIDSGES